MIATRSLCVVFTLAVIVAGPRYENPVVAAESATTSKPIRIVLVGDSTVSTYDTRPADKPDLTGWGQVFGDFFNDKVTVLNHAASGRSTRSFIKEGRWKKALADKGDYIFVQFGHNDSHVKDGKPAVDPVTDFQSYLRQYIDEARAAGAKPILVTPVARRTFEGGKVVTGLQAYADAMFKVGKEKGVPVIDLHAAAMRLYDRLGDAGSADLNAAASDRTHFSRKGALAMARLVADALPQAVPELRPYLKSVAAETDAQPQFPIEHVPAPLFDDPIWHGAADPTVIWAPDQKEWRIYYTQRRAALKNPHGVDWCHGSAIGIAASKDGVNWEYAGICTGDEGLGEPIERKCTWWAPCVIRLGGQFHLFVACVDGIYTQWMGKRTVKHFTSTDGKTWKYEMTLPLSSDNCIDPCIYHIGDRWLVWYKDEGHGSRTYAAESPDLKTWKIIGPAVTDVHHEAPLVWRWKGAYWMIVDAWAGLRIYRSTDGLGNWKYNTTILSSPGKRAKDGVKGGHPFVLEQGDHPVVFYHVHFAKGRQTVLQAAELDMDDAGKVICNRDKYAAAAESSANKPADCYLFSYFVGNGEDGLHLAKSSDGYHWQALRGGKSFLKPQVGKSKLMRDPCLLYGPDGTFQLVWTDSWDSRTIGHASSTDLLHWSEQHAIPVMEHEPQAMNCWAPEVVYDGAKQHYIVFWSTTIPGRFPETDGTGDNHYNHRVYCTTTSDFKNFAPAKLLYDDGFNVIDATMLHAEGKYYLIVKDETLNPVKKNLRLAVGDSPEGPFGAASAPFTASWAEGPSAIRIGDEYLVYFDRYRERRYGAARSRNLKDWQDITSLVSFPNGTKHGTALRVPASVVEKLDSER